MYILSTYFLLHYTYAHKYNHTKQEGYADNNIPAQPTFAILLSNVREQSIFLHRYASELPPSSYLATSIRALKAAGKPV